MTANTSLLTFAILLARPALSPAAVPIPVALAPISSETLHGCDEADLEKALKGSFGKAKRFRFVPTLEQAAARIEVVECSRLEHHKQTVTSKGGPVKGPVGVGGIGVGADNEVGAQSESVRSVILRARVVSGTRFVGVASGPKDRTLREAAQTLRHAIDRALKDVTNGCWPLGPSLSSKGRERRVDERARDPGHG